jgi:hypothetical protein
VEDGFASTRHARRGRPGRCGHQRAGRGTTGCAVREVRHGVVCVSVNAAGNRNYWGGEIPYRWGGVRDHRSHPLAVGRPLHEGRRPHGTARLVRAGGGWGGVAGVGVRRPQHDSGGRWEHGNEWRGAQVGTKLKGR